MIKTLKTAMNTKIALSSLWKLNTIILLLFSFYGIANAQTIYQLPSDIVIEKPIGEEDFPIVSINGSASVISYDKSDHPGVLRAINDLQNDIDGVTGKRPTFITNGESADFEIIVGTLGKNKQIDKLVSSMEVNNFSSAV